MTKAAFRIWKEGEIIALFHDDANLIVRQYRKILRQNHKNG